MHYIRHRLTTLVTTRLRTHQPMTNGLALFAHRSVHQKLNPASSVQCSSVSLLCTRLKESKK